MKGKDILYLLLGLAAAAFAVWRAWLFFSAAGKEGPKTDLILAIVGAVVACIFGVLLLVGHVNKEEEIHITQ
jgi:membrane associated rhomboid family serine protease